MQPSISPNHSLYRLFYEAIHKFMRNAAQQDVERYLTDLLVSFMHVDRIFVIRNSFGERLHHVIDMLEESDVLLNADSFEREREVHKHIGDFILFWLGIYPAYLNQQKFQFGKGWGYNYVRQGKESYYIVSTFDYEPYKEESRIYHKLSVGFEDYAHCLKQVREALHV